MLVTRSVTSSSLRPVPNWAAVRFQCWEVRQHGRTDRFSARWPASLVLKRFLFGQLYRHLRRLQTMNRCQVVKEAVYALMVNLNALDRALCSACPYHPLPLQTMREWWQTFIAVLKADRYTARALRHHRSSGCWAGRPQKLLNDHAASGGGVTARTRIAKIAGAAPSEPNIFT